MTYIVYSKLYDAASGQETVGDVALNVLAGDVLIGVFRDQATSLSTLEIEENDDTDQFTLFSDATVGTHAMRMGWLKVTADDSSFTPRSVISVAATYRCLGVLQFRPDSGKELSLDVSASSATGSDAAPTSPSISTADAGVVINALALHSSSYSPTSWTIGGNAVDGNLLCGNARLRIGYEMFSSAQSSIRGVAALAGAINWISSIMAIKETTTETPTYGVTYEGNGATGGDVPVDSTEYDSGDTVTVLGNTGSLVKAGATFDSWNTSANGSGTTYSANDTFNISSDTTLYAQWVTSSTYGITYNGNGSTSGDVPTDAGKYFEGQTTQIQGRNTLQKTGHLFGGWSTRADHLGTLYRESSLCSYGEITFGAANITLYAIWIDITETVATGTSWYLSPTGSWSTGVGTEANPFGPLSGLQASNKLKTRQWASGPLSTLTDRNPSGVIKPGDTLLLMAGYHGDASINRAYNSSPVVVMGLTGSQVGSIELEGAARWKFKNIWAGEKYRSGASVIGYTIDIADHVAYGPCAEITLDNIEVVGISDDPTTLTDTQWNSNTSSAFNIEADTVVVRNVTAKTVKSGIMCYGDNFYLKSTLVDGHCNDGYRMNGNAAIWDDFHERDCYKTNSEYHNDAFQSFVDANTPNLEWCGNSFTNFTFINWYRSGNNYKGSCQGFGCYDGWYNDWYIANGLIDTSHTNNFAMLGFKNIRIENVGCIDPIADSMDSVCIRMRAHKDTTTSENCIIRNCYGTVLPAIDANTVNGSYDHCAVVSPSQYTTFFEDYDAFDFTPTETATALVDQGSAEILMSLDAAGNTRSVGSSVDIGPFEYGAEAPTGYLLTISSNGATSGYAPAAAYHDGGSTFSLPDNIGYMKRTGYGLTGLNTAMDGSGTHYDFLGSYTMPTSDTTLYAEWELLSITVSFNRNGAETGDVPSPIVDEYGETIQMPENTGALSLSGMEMYGWNTASDGSGYHYALGDSYILVADITLYAEWREEGEVSTLIASNKQSVTLEAQGDQIANIGKRLKVHKIFIEGNADTVAGAEYSIRCYPYSENDVIAHGYATGAYFYREIDFNMEGGLNGSLGVTATVLGANLTARLVTEKLNV